MLTICHQIRIQYIIGTEIFRGRKMFLCMSFFKKRQEVHLLPEEVPHVHPLYMDQRPQKALSYR